MTLADGPLFGSEFPERHPPRSATLERMIGFELSGGVQLRLLTDHDVDELHALVTANRDHLARWLPWAARQTVADTRAFVRMTRRQFAENNGFQLAVVQDGRIV